MQKIVKKDFIKPLCMLLQSFTTVPSAKIKYYRIKILSFLH